MPFLCRKGAITQYLLAAVGKAYGINLNSPEILFKAFYFGIGLRGALIR